jgi:hypothetical protein
MSQIPAVAVRPGSVHYELQVSTFTPEGTLTAAADRLDHLVKLGVDVVELAPEPAEAGTGLAGFVTACHACGLAVLLGLSQPVTFPEVHRLFARYRLDGVRAPGVTAELAAQVDALGRELGRPLTLLATESGDAVEHGLHALLTGDGRAVEGAPETLADVLHEALLHAGSRSPGGHRALTAYHFGADLPRSDTDPALVRVGAMLLLTGPFTPLVQMGEEWGASAPGPWPLAVAGGRGRATGTLPTGTAGRRNGALSIGAVGRGSVALSIAAAGRGSGGSPAALAERSPRALLEAAPDRIAGAPAATDRSSGALLEAARDRSAGALLEAGTDRSTGTLLEAETDRNAGTLLEAGTDRSNGALLEAASERGGGAVAEVSGRGIGAPLERPPRRGSALQRCAGLDWSEPDAPGHAELLDFYRRLIALRRSTAELADPRPDRTRIGYGDQFITMRRANYGVVANLAATHRRIALDGYPRQVLLASGPGVRLTRDSVDLPPHCAVIVSFT